MLSAAQALKLSNARMEELAGFSERAADECSEKMQAIIAERAAAAGVKEFLFNLEEIIVKPDVAEEVWPQLRWQTIRGIQKRLRALGYRVPETVCDQMRVKWKEEPDGVKKLNEDRHARTAMQSSNDGRLPT